MSEKLRVDQDYIADAICRALRADGLMDADEAHVDLRYLDAMGTVTFTATVTPKKEP